MLCFPPLTTRAHARRDASSALFILALGCTHIPNPRDPGVPDGYPIERVRIAGAEAIDAGALVSGLANRPPSGFFTKRYYRFDELQVELDRRRIRSFYERKGYFGVEVDGPKTERVGDRAERLALTWTINEGEPTRVEEVYISGLPEGLEGIERYLKLDEGDIYESAAFDQAKERLRAVLVRRGYAAAAVSGRVLIDRSRSAAKVILDLDAGPLVHMGDLIPVGTVRTPTSAVVVRKTWEEEDVFDPAELEQLRGRLYAIDQYAGVRLDYEGGEISGDTADIVARVDEAEQNELQLGVGAGLDPTSIYLRAQARYKRRSFPLPLTNTIVELIPAVQTLRESPEGAFFDPEFTPQARLAVIWYDFLFPRFELETELRFQYEQLEAYEWFGPEIGQTLSRPTFDDRLKAGIGWRFRQYGYADPRVPGPGNPLLMGQPSAQEILGILDGQSVFVIQPALTWEGRNDVLEPTRGVFARFSLDFGLATNADSAGFLAIHPEVRGYLPILGPRLVLAARLNLITNLEGDLPAPLRVYAGGAASQRGFPQRRLSPSALLIDAETGLPPGFDRNRPLNQQDLTFIPIGGETVFEMNLEVRLRLFRLFGFWFGMVAFLDGADLGDRIADLRFPELHYAAGGGLRYLTPIGAVRLDYGYRLNRTGPGEFFPCDGGPFDCGAIHFSLGQAF